MGETNVLLDRDRRPLTRAVLARASRLIESASASGRPRPGDLRDRGGTGWAPTEAQAPASPRRKLSPFTEIPEISDQRGVGGRHGPSIQFGGPDPLQG
jgi:hypothetical protein